MHERLQIFLVLGCLSFLIIIINMLRKEKIDLKYSLVWLLSGISLILFSIWPMIIIDFAKFIGIIEPVNAVFLLVIFFLLLIIFSLTVALSNQSIRVRKIAQELALIEDKFSSKKVTEDSVDE